jgi:hypothetical protein
MRHSDATKAIRFVVLNGRVKIGVRAYQERVMISILDACQSSILEDTNHVQVNKRTFRSGPTMDRGQVHQGSLFRRYHNHWTFDVEPTTDGSVASIERECGGTTSGV